MSLVGAEGGVFMAVMLSVGRHQSQIRRVANIWQAFVLLAMLAPAVLAGCGAPSASSHASKAGLASTSINITIEADRFEFTTPQAMCKAPLVADIIAGTYGQAHWNTPSGSHSVTLDHQTILTQGYFIFTPLQVVSVHPLLDRRQEQTQEFVLVGGQVGRDVMRVEDFPWLITGSRYLVVFAPAHVVGTPVTTQTTLEVYNAFPIDSHDIVTLQQQSIEQGKIAQPTITMPLVQIQQQLAACH